MVGDALRLADHGAADVRSCIRAHVGRRQSPLGLTSTSKLSADLRPVLATTILFPKQTCGIWRRRYVAMLKASDRAPTRMRLKAQAASRLNQLREMNLRPRYR